MTETMMAPADAETAEGGASNKPLIIAGCAAGALLLLGGGFFLLKGGGSSQALPPVVKHVVKVHPAVAVKPAKPRSATTKVATLPPASSVTIGRDPFAALYIMPVAAPNIAAPPAGGTGSAGSTSQTAGTAAQPGSATSTNARYTIVLTKITQDPGGSHLYTFTVAGKPKTVLTAQRFGSYGELVVLTNVKNSKGSSIGVVLQVGDDNPVEVLIGSKTSVQ